MQAESRNPYLPATTGKRRHGRRAAQITVGGAFATAAAGLGGFLPWLASLGLTALGNAAAFLGIGFFGMAAFFEKSADTPVERALWSFLGLVVLVTVAWILAVAWSNIHPLVLILVGLALITGAVYYTSTRFNHKPGF